MAFRRTAVRQFQLANNAYKNAVVTFYTVDLETLEPTTTLATVYTSLTGNDQASNPYTLDSTGKAATPLYVDEPVMATVSQATVPNHNTGIIFPTLTGFRGDWAPQTDYLVGDTIRDGAAGDNTRNLYIALEDHTSTNVWATDLANVKWLVVVDVGSILADAENAANSAQASAATASASDTSAAASATLASQWAMFTGGQVAATDYSAKEYAVGSFIRGMANLGSAKDWAVYTGGVVDDTGFSAKAWAVGGSGVTNAAGGGAAKEWANKTGSTVDGTEYSAKHYSALAAISETNAGVSETNSASSESAAAASAAAAAASAAAAAAAAVGFTWTEADAITTAALPANTYDNGSSGVGATLTGNSNGALSAQDGVTLTMGQILVVKDEASALKNGVYELTQVGDGSNPYILTRTTATDSWAELTSLAVVINGGTLNSGAVYLTTVNAGGTIGTDPVTWTQLQVPVNSVSNDKLAQMAAYTVKMNNTASPANPVDATMAQLAAVMPNFTGDSGAGGVKGLVPAPSAGDAAALKFLKADGNWAAPPTFTGDSGSGGAKGYVPAPAAGDAAAGKFLKADGNWTAISVSANVQTFNSNGTWTKPTGYSPGTLVYIQMWGGGGGGSAFGGTVAGAGGNSSFGSHLTAYGGARGERGADTGNGGAGGGFFAAGSGLTNDSSTVGYITEGSGSDTSNNAGRGITCGGGGGSGSRTAGGKSEWGGGGGAGYGGTGGTSRFGGAGGNSGVAGSAPGGGGGGNGTNGGGGGGGAYREKWVLLSALGATESVTVGAGGAANSGTAGAAGRVIITVFA